MATNYDHSYLMNLPGLKSAGGGSSFGSAAAAAGSIPDMYGVMAKNRIDAGKIYGTGMQLRAEEQKAAWDAEAGVKIAGVNALSNVMGAHLQAEAAKKAAKAQASAKKSSGMMGGIGAVVGAGLSLLSDERTKHSVERLDDVTLMLRELNPVSFYYKADYTDEPKRQHYGFIAQEYKDVMPDATHYDTDSGMLTIDINQLIALLVRGYQQLDNRVTRMEAKNALAGALK